jgi:soluble lytic murein transglycosylase-like protein
MQVMPDTASRFGVEPHLLFDPEPNLRAGTRYLGWLGDRYRGDISLVLSAYNAGEAAVDRFGGVPPYSETREYLRRVEATLDQARRGQLRMGRERWSIDFY